MARRGQRHFLRYFMLMTSFLLLVGIDVRSRSLSSTKLGLSFIATNIYYGYYIITDRVWSSAARSSDLSAARSSCCALVVLLVFSCFSIHNYIHVCIGYQRAKLALLHSHHSIIILAPLTDFRPSLHRTSSGHQDSGYSSETKPCT